MCVRITSILHEYNNGINYSEKVNYFNIRDKKFGYLSGLGEVEIPDKNYKNSVVRMFGIEH